MKIVVTGDSDLTPDIIEALEQDGLDGINILFMDEIDVAKPTQADWANMGDELQKAKNNEK